MPCAPRVVSRDCLHLPSVAVLPSISPSARISNSPRVAWHPSADLRPSHIPLSQLAEASSGGSSLRSPARTELGQASLAPRAPWLGRERAGGRCRQQARGWVETKALLERSWSFHGVEAQFQYQAPSRQKACNLS